MAKASVSWNSCVHGGDGWSNDIWSQKARRRMSTARERTFTTPMSAEAAMAMQQLTKSTKEKAQKSTLTGRHEPRRIVKKGTPDTERIKEGQPFASVKLSDVYEKLGVQQKLEGDITDPSTWDESATKFVLGGGKIGNAMEIVEIINADEPKAQSDTEHVQELDDEHAIAEIARINSINKCNVWFEAHESLLDSSQPSTSTNELCETNVTHERLKDK